MADWYRIPLTRDEYDSGELEILQGAFHEAYVARNAPKGMALLGAWNEPRTEYWVYCTPASTRHIRPLLEAYSAEKHSPNRPRSLTLICGDEAGLSVLLC